MQIPATSQAVSPVSFTLGPAEHGWIELTVAAGGASDTIMCSNVYDPFPGLVDWVGRLAEGGNGRTVIDEEGEATVLWLDREPGSYVGRLRVFEEGTHGEPETVRIDAIIDVIQLADAFHTALAAYVPTYDTDHWNPDFVQEGPVPRTLAALDLKAILWHLSAMGLAPRYEGEIGYAERVAAARAAYERQLAATAVPARTVTAEEPA